MHDPNKNKDLEFDTVGKEARISILFSLQKDIHSFIHSFSNAGRVVCMHSLTIYFIPFGWVPELAFSAKRLYTRSRSRSKVKVKVKQG